MSRVRTEQGRLVEAKPRSRAARFNGDARDAHWPASRFLWAVVDSPGASRAGPLAPGLWPQLAEQVHVDPDALAAVSAPLGNGRALVCAVEQDRMAQLPPGTLRLTPESIPDGLGDEKPDPAHLDLLVGDHLPGPCRARSRLRHLLAASGVCAVALLAALGLARRAAVWDRAARDADARAGLAAASIDPRATLADLPFLAEEARAQQQSTAALGRIEPVAPVLADLLSRWPASSPPSTLSVDPRAILATVLVEGDPGEFLAQLKAPAGWVVREPRLGTLAEGTQITIVMERAGPPAGGAP
jgi:hypothetical protein